jgi:hypothetical protein
MNFGRDDRFKSCTAGLALTGLLSAIAAVVASD